MWGTESAHLKAEPVWDVVVMVTFSPKAPVCLVFRWGAGLLEGLLPQCLLCPQLQVPPLHCASVGASPPALYFSQQ